MFYIFSIISKIIHKVTVKMRKGSGYTLPGYLALKIHPHLLGNTSIHFKKGLVLVSGTNGKTTTSKLIAHLLEGKGHRVLHNRSGANLLSGILTTILLAVDLKGKLDFDYGVFEVDEFALPAVLGYMSPTVLVLLNLSRDQLDRYGETDIIFERWSKAVAGLGNNTSIVYPGEEVYFNALGERFSGNIVKSSGEGALLHLTGLKGRYNSVNLGLAVTSLKLLGLSYTQEDIASSLSGFSVAYGRGETIHYGGKCVTIHLAKNPVSFNRNMEVLSEDVGVVDTLLFVLNDGIPDGRDVSWIYDIEPALLKNACEGKEVYVSGTRALDMAVRLHYAGVEISEQNVIPSLSKAIYRTVAEKHSGTVYIYPNYSAMLETRQLLTGRKIL
jgi:lipid II isoglutaminyl synthase (glutamine-hydrolysing)